MRYAVRRKTAFASASVVLTILLVSITYATKNMWTYFTNWGLAIQYAAYVSVLDSAVSRQWLVDSGILVAWTVAVCYSVVIAISHETRDTLYKEYGAFPFWFGNSVLHYIPPLLISVSIIPLRGSTQKRFYCAVGLSALIVVYNLVHDTEDVYDSDVFPRTLGTFFMVSAVFVLVFVVFNFHKCINVLIPESYRT
tara:strand:- start:335 stop:919 length:585 start_codon:yes stop_codon:yes gene_type:complete